MPGPVGMTRVQGPKWGLFLPLSSDGAGLGRWSQGAGLGQLVSESWSGGDGLWELVSGSWTLV